MEMVNEFYDIYMTGHRAVLDDWQSVGQVFRAATCLPFVSAVGSPVFLMPQEIPSEEDLVALDDYFAPRLDKTNIAHAQAPYFSCWENEDLFDVERIAEAVNQHGWHAASEEMYVCMWRDVEPQELADKFSIVEGHAGTDVSRGHFLEHLQIAFEMSDEMTAHVNQFWERFGSRLKFVGIKNQRGRLVASSSFVKTDVLGFLNGGCVSQEYRQMGLWQVLLAERMRRFEGRPGVLVSGVQHIVRKAQFKYPVVTFYKK